MKLGDLLREGQVLTGFRAKDKWEAIDALVALLAAQGRLKPDQVKPVTDALVARERVASTGMEHGVAIPHASVDGLEEALAVLALSPEGVPFQSADHLPAKILILLVIPRRSMQTHIRTLAGVARLVNYEETRESLLRTRSPREALQVIRDEEKQED